MKHLAKSAMAGALLILLSKLLGFAREVCLAYRFGTSYIVDVYTACIALPNVLFALYAYGFSDAYIPVSSRLRGTEERRTFFNNAMTILLLLSFVISALCAVFASPLAVALEPGFDARSHALLAHFIRIIAFIFPIRTAFSLLSAELQIREDFILGYFGSALIDILLIVSILLATPEAPDILVIGYTVSLAVPLLLLAVHARCRQDIRFRPRVALRDGAFASLCALALPIGASRVVTELNGVADRMFASLLEEGVTSALSYAHKVQLIFHTLTTAVFLSVCNPRINKRFAENDKEGGMFYIRRAAMIAAYISIPVMGGLFLFARPVVALLFERGSFTAQSTEMTAGCLACYALGLPFYALREIGVNALSASCEQKRILKNTTISVVCNVALNLALFRPLGYIGLALATSMAGAVAAALMLLDMRRLDMRLAERAQLPELGKIALASALGLLGCLLAYRALLGAAGGAVAIIAGIFAAGALYLTASILLRIDIFVWLYGCLPAKWQILPMGRKS